MLDNDYEHFHFQLQLLAAKAPVAPCNSSPNAFLLRASVSRHLYAKKAATAAITRNAAPRPAPTPIVALLSDLQLPVADPPDGVLSNVVVDEITLVTVTRGRLDGSTVTLAVSPATRIGPAEAAARRTVPFLVSQQFRAASSWPQQNV
jgi:hypothetical protein